MNGLDLVGPYGVLSRLRGVESVLIADARAGRHGRHP